MGAKLNIEIDPGATIECAAQDAQRIADLLGIAVGFSFNGVSCRAVPGGSWELLSDRQQHEQSRPLIAPRDWRFAHSTIPR